MSSAIVKLVGESLRSASGSVQTAEVLKNKLVALYFSAHWCPPCRAFTPEFARIYTSLQTAGKPFAVVFVSADQDQSAFDEYFAEQPWYAVPYENQEQRDALNEKFNIRGIPALLVVNQEGEVVSKEGRPEVIKNKEKVFDLWESKTGGKITPA